MLKGNKLDLSCISRCDCFVSSLQNSPASSLEFVDETNGSVTMVFKGELRTESITEIWGKARKKILHPATAKVSLDANDVTYCDGTGIAMLADLLLEAQRRKGIDVSLVGLKDDFQQLLDQFDLAHFKPEPDLKPKPIPIAEEIGRTAIICFRI
jgi:ABC-type transporter Mla MlaB component